MCVVAEVDDAQQVSVESGGHSGEEELSMSQMAEGRGQTGRPRPRGAPK